MDKLLSPRNWISNQTITITGSKSETNRLLILQQLYRNLHLENTSTSHDSKVMVEAFCKNCETIDVHHAGTAMRFLTAYLSVFGTRKSYVLTGSQRMKQRPIAPLVDALRQLGAHIEYLEEIGFPPLKIFPKKITTNTVTISANISSQYITALMLIAPKLPNGLSIVLQGNIASKSYILMTQSVLKKLGITVQFLNNTIHISPKKNMDDTTFFIESDWSSASYFFAALSIQPLHATIRLGLFNSESYQGDAQIVKLFEQFGIATAFSDQFIQLTKISPCQINHFEYDFSDMPDMAQTFIIVCVMHRITCHFKGLSTLKVKETNRIHAMKCELEKFNLEIITDDDSFQINNTIKPIQQLVNIETYNDHRMAMSFAPLSYIQPLKIKNAEVVAKSYPTFWDDWDNIGI